ncbi:MAG: site-specific integrase [Burkholderiaceae bacterium]|nr:site-specific integrase [Rhodoferax sp.]MCP5271530.1 site-specific integrase [Burkholderiaceae bacterium]
MAKVTARKETGRLVIDFTYRGVRCREQTALADTAANRKRVESMLAKIKSAMAAGTFAYRDFFPGSPLAGRFDMPQAAPASPPGTPALPASAPAAAASAAASPTPTFKDFTGTWLSEHQIEWRRSHLKVLKCTLDGHLLPHFGDKPVGTITKADILAFRTKLADLPGRAAAKLSNKRINGILAPMRQILAEAADRYGFVSPTLNLKPLRLRKTDVEPFALEQVQQMLATVRADWRNYFTVRFFTGMRTGEAHGLKWKYVDFEKRLILIRETFVLGEDEYTKTDSSQRDIQMTQVVFEALQAQHAATAKLSDYVFCNKEGKPLDNDNFGTRVWYPLLRHLGLKKRRPYQMRHTAATLWLASGEAPEWIARQLGHSSTEMLFRVYSRYVPNLTRQDGSAIDRLLATRFATTSAVPVPAPAPASGRSPSASAAASAPTTTEAQP